LRKATVGFVMYVRLCVRMEQLGCHLTDFHEIWYLFRKYFWKVQVSLKSDKNNCVLYMKTNIHLWYFVHFFLEWEMFETKVIEKMENWLSCCDALTTVCRGMRLRQLSVVVWGSDNCLSCCEAQTTVHTFPISHLRPYFICVSISKQVRRQIWLTLYVRITN
jgi:hypothetical protein